MEVCRLIIVKIFIFSLILRSSEATARNGNHLHVGFYNKTCPQVEKIVADVVSRAVVINPGIPAGLIRLFFHDCFVNGCDASILLDSTPSGETVEKESPANAGTLRGLEVTDEIKAKIEQECPAIVSCADVLAFAAREAVVHSGLPSHLVPAGRRDSLSSRACDVFGNIPGPGTPLNTITEIFAKKGLTPEEMVVLTGAHSIGIAHCKSFDYRLYNFSQTHWKDPDLDKLYANYLSTNCLPPDSLLKKVVGDRTVNFDYVSPHRLDNSFYINTLKGKALLQSDQAMASDPRTGEIMQRMAFDPKAWSEKFAKAMIRLGRVDVLTGKEGEIRKNCRAIN